ncbi:CaDmium Responsive [Caenorhabditis elegans]|uniref:CaDmium Responsive n=1 Tax=Caenorhabditis elegans TaxID=6239 RepID=G5EE89_CAEEL|nr:CaDmium Responsive [Caenorhabditis elegans]AAG30870.1 cadmium-inducible lysosomal protein CDR-1 [Caenorhabditis elegans]CAB04302.1 CaDmium Responsive [Caenorhabditis elegans]|eukprot:NP_506986.1 CaDmium Responsive [Caenorhabditis elegans]
MLDSCLIITAALFGAAVIYLKNFFTVPSIKPKPDIHKKDYKKDVVYLYQMKRLKNCPNLSPFCMKIEILCRIFKIPYEIITCTSERSRNGLVPFVELNGEHIADSDLIEMRLRSHFKIPSLPTELETQSVALSKFADHHLFFVLIRFKIAVDEFYKTIIEIIGLPTFLNFLLMPLLKAIIGKNVYNKCQGAIGDFELSELDEILHRDLRIVENTLAKKKFLFGEEITAADATVFSQLATVYYPFRNHISDVLEKDFPKLLEYCERVRHEVYPKDFTM